LACTCVFKIVAARSALTFFFQVYVEKMRAELASSDTGILDHSVESVLPGVHEYLTSLHTEVRASRADISMLAEKVESCSDSKIRESVKEVVQQCLGPALAPFSALSNSLNLMAASLRSSLQFRTVSTATSAIDPLVQDESSSLQASPMDEDDDDASPPPGLAIRPPSVEDGIGRHPKPTYISIHELYEEFYGLGKFEGKPVAGGFAKLDELFKTKWRQHFSKSQKKEWSRLTMTVRGINVHIEELGKIELALNNLDLVFQDKHGVNHTTSKMILYMQDKGWLTKSRARGRYAPANGSNG
jgi:hypothetical protein